MGRHSYRSIGQTVKDEKLDHRVDILIGQLKEIATRHQNTQTNAEQQTGATADNDNFGRPATSSAQDDVKRGTPEKHDDKHAIGELEERLAALEARNKELENEKFNLEIDKRARDQIVGIMRDQMNQQTKVFSSELTQQSRRVGQLETEMRQLMAPERDRRPTRDDSRTVDDGNAIEAEYHDRNAPAAPNHDDVSAIPGGVSTPVFIEISRLAFRKHLCHHVPLIRTISLVACRRV